MIIGNNYYIKIENDETKRFTYIELLIMTLIWPIHIVLVLFYLIGNKKQ